MTWNPARRWAGGEQTPFFPAQCRPLGMEPLHPWSVRIQGYKDATGVNVLFFFWLRHLASRILVLQPGMETRPWAVRGTES